MTRKAPDDFSALKARIAQLLVSFKVPTVASELSRRIVESGHDEVLPVVCEVLEAEASGRAEKRVERLLKASKLAPGKTFATLNERRFPRPLWVRLRELASGAFVERADNVLAFGLPGTGKSHAAAAIGEAVIHAGHSVLFTPTYQIVQELLAARRDLALPKALRTLDNFDLLILDDLGYVQQTPEEAEVLFTLMAERYERKSIFITSNLVFSQWDRIFKNPMTTAAAIDRLVHHAVILEFADVESYRGDEAKKRNRKNSDNYQPEPTQP
jgi:DNA replication protein DnaC